MDACSLAGGSDSLPVRGRRWHHYNGAAGDTLKERLQRHFFLRANHYSQISQKRKREAPAACAALPGFPAERLCLSERPKCFEPAPPEAKPQAPLYWPERHSLSARKAAKPQLQNTTNTSTQKASDILRCARKVLNDSHQRMLSLHQSQIGYCPHCAKPPGAFRSNSSPPSDSRRASPRAPRRRDH